MVDDDAEFSGEGVRDGDLGEVDRITPPAEAGVQLGNGFDRGERFAQLGPGLRRGGVEIGGEAFADDHFLGRTTIVEVRTGTAIRGSSMLPGVGPDGIGGAAPM